MAEILMVDQHVELFRRQFLQLVNPSDLTLPPAALLKQPAIQAQIFASMFQEGNLPHPPPDRYKSRVLKILVEAMEQSIDDPDEDEISDDLTSCLAEYLAKPTVSDAENAQRKCYVTYSDGPLISPARMITTLESPALLAAAGTTGLRTWEAAKFLCSFLCSSRGEMYVTSKRVIELGAGTGLVSMFCARHLGAEFTLATDGTGDVVDSIVENMYLNGLDSQTKMNTVVLKWGHAVTDELILDEDGTKHYNLILGADIIFDDRLILPLVSTLHELFGRYKDMTGLIAATVRKEETVTKFLQACASLKLTTRVIHSSLDTEDMPQTGFFHASQPEIKIFELTRLQ